MMEEMKKKLHTRQTTDDEDGHTDKEKTGKGHAAARLSTTTKTSMSTRTAALFQRNLRRQSRRRASTLGRLHIESNARKRTTCKQQSESRRGPSGRARFTGGRQGRLPNTTRTAGPKLSPTGTQQYQPSTEGDRPRGGKTTSTSTYSQTDPTERTTISRAT